MSEAIEFMDADIECPVTGEVVSRTDVEGLAETLDRIDHQLGELRAAQNVVRQAIGERAHGKARTERVMGEQGSVLRVEWPDDSWDQPTLKRVYESGYGKELLRIARVEIDKRAYKKAQGTMGPADYERVKAEIESARRPPSQAPRVRIEKLRGVEYGS